MIFTTNFQPMRRRNIWSALWVSTRWIVDRSWPVTEAPDLVSCQPLLWLGECLECCSRVLSTLQIMYDFSFFSTSRYFCSWWFSIPFFKGLHIHLKDRRFDQFEGIEKLTWNCSSLTIIADAAFLLFAIVICSLKHPILIYQNWSEYIKTHHISNMTLDTWPNRRGPYLQRLTYFVGYDI